MPILGLGHLGDEGGEDLVGDASMSDALTQRADALKAQAGRWNIPEVLYQKADILKLRVIHEGERAALYSRCKSLGYDEQQQQRQNLIDQQGQETLQVFWSTQNESAALLRQRAAVRNMINHRDDGLLIPPQQLINESVFHTAIVWETTTISLLFMVVPQAQRLVMVLKNAADSYHILPDLSAGVPLPNVIVYGSAATSKSYALMIAGLTHLPGAAMTEAYQTTHSYCTGGNEGYQLIIKHEFSTSELIDPTDNPSKGAHGDPQKTAFAKAMMTEFQITSRIMVLDPETKKRYPQILTTLTHGVQLGGYNGKEEGIHEPLKSRYIFYITKKTSSEDPSQNVSNYKRQTSSDTSTEAYDVLQQHHCIDAVMCIYTVLVNAGVLSDSLSEHAVELIDKVLERLRSYGMPAESFGIRRTQTVHGLVRTLAMKTAIFALLGTELGHAWLRETKRKPEDWETLRDFVAPRALATTEHLVYVLTLLDFQFIGLYDEDVLTLLAARMIKHNDPRRYVPLSVLASEMHGSEDVLVALGLRKQPLPNEPFQFVPNSPRHPGHNAVAAAAAHAGKDMGRNVLVGGALPSAAAPVNPGSVVAGEEVLKDWRYLVLVAKSEEQLVKDLVQDLKCFCHYEIRPSEIHQILKNAEKQWIEAPYLKPDEGSGRLVRCHRSGERTLLVDRIPCLIVRPLPSSEAGAGARGATPKVQVGLSIHFMFKRLAMGFLVGEDCVEFEHTLTAGSLTMDQKQGLLERLKLLPLARMQQPTISAAEARKEGKLAALAECDLCLRPMARAIYETLGHRYFGSVGEADGLDDPAFAKRTFITAYPPPSFRLRISVAAPWGAGGPVVGTEEVLEAVNLSSMMQVLTIHRSTDPRHILFFENHGRARATARAVHRSALRLTADEPNLHMESLEKPGHIYDQDHDLVATLARFEAMGGRGEPLMQMWHDQQGLTQSMPWFFSPQFDKIMVKMAKAAGRLPPNPTPYPLTDIAEDVEMTIQRATEKHTHQWHVVPSVRQIFGKRTYLQMINKKQAQYMLATGPRALPPHAATGTLHFAADDGDEEPVPPVPKGAAAGFHPTTAMDLEEGL